MGAFYGIRRILSLVPLPERIRGPASLLAPCARRKHLRSALEPATLSKTSQYGSPGPTTSPLLPNLVTTLHPNGTNRHK
jgi:hypothetical protein